MFVLGICEEFYLEYVEYGENVIVQDGLNIKVFMGIECNCVQDDGIGWDDDVNECCVFV